MTSDLAGFWPIASARLSKSRCSRDCRQLSLHRHNVCTAQRMHRRRWNYPGSVQSFVEFQALLCRRTSSSGSRLMRLPRRENSETKHWKNDEMVDYIYIYLYILFVHIVICIYIYVTYSYICIHSYICIWFQKYRWLDLFLEMGWSDFVFRRVHKIRQHEIRLD